MEGSSCCRSCRSGLQEQEWAIQGLDWRQAGVVSGQLMESVRVCKQAGGALCLSVTCWHCPSPRTRQMLDTDATSVATPGQYSLLCRQ